VISLFKRHRAGTYSDASEVRVYYGNEDLSFLEAHKKN